MDALELMSEGRQHWRRVREEERKGEAERREREREGNQGRSGILGKADDTQRSREPAGKGKGKG